MIQRSEVDPCEQEQAAIPSVEAVLFVASEPISVRRLAEITGEPVESVRAELKRLQAGYAGPQRGVHLVEIAGGWRVLSNPDCHEAVAAVRGQKAPDRLSAAALETLAIVAYRQPVSRAEVERIRGVGVGPILRHLLELDLVKVSGREDSLGRALLYGTTRDFLDRFGLKSIKDLPASLEL